VSKSLQKEYYQDYKSKLIQEFDLNVMESPCLVKVVINVSSSDLTNSATLDNAFNYLYKITGQKPVITKAKKAISNFKIRQGQTIGCKVTLRRQKMYDFITKFFNVSVPKIRDFRGFSKKSFDKFGNYSLGINDRIFVESSESFGMGITFVTSSHSPQQSLRLLTLLGLPFRK